jgi:O-methyltransferase domain
LRLVEADIFRPWPVTGDAIVFSRVLHDWDDEAAEKILTNAHNALNSNGQVFVVEMLLAETGYAGALCDLHLLAVTGGRKRTLPMYKELLRRTGFALTDVRRLPTLPAVLVGCHQRH